MNEELTMDETMETTEVTPVETNYTTTESNSGSSMVAKAVIVGAVGAFACAAAFGMKKLKAYNEKKTIEHLRKQGWYIEEPYAEEDDYVEDKVVSGEDTPESKEK